MTTILIGWAFVREEMLSDGANNTDSAFQRLRVEPSIVNSDFSLSQPHTMVAEGDDLKSRWALMRDFADEVNSAGYESREDRISSPSNRMNGRRGAAI